MGKIAHFQYLSKEYSTKLAIQYAMNAVATQTGKVVGRYPASLYCSTSEYTYTSLIEKYIAFISSWKNNEETAESFSDVEAPPAWTCWFQGYNRAPDLIKRLIDIQKMHLPEYDHHVVTRKNFDLFAEIPGFIVDALDRGEISVTHFTDILRSALLKENGGLWLDSTMLLTADISTDVLHYPFFTLKGLNLNFAGSELYPEIAFWEGYFIGGKRNALFYKFMYEFFLEYWRNETQLVQYLLINQVAKIGINELEVLGAEYKAIPDTNQSCELLDGCLRSSEVIYELPRFADKTKIFKLSRRADYNLESLDNVLRLAECRNRVVS